MRAWRTGIGFAIGLATGCAYYAWNRHKVVEEVSPELRHPALYLPMHLLTDGGFVAISKLIANHDYIRAVERDVDVRVIHGEFEGQKFSARLLAPRNQKPGAPALLWTHGGGHLIGSPGFYDPQNSRIADELGAVVLAPSYRKSTAAPFPADHDECYAALRWLQEHAEEVGVDKHRIAVAGDSAGGGLAAGVVQRALDEGHPVVFQGLVYPMIDHRTLRAQSGRGEFIWTPNSNRGAWSKYLGADHLEAEIAPYASPATRADLRGLPPTWIGVGSLDLFYDEAKAHADALQEAGVPVDFQVYEGAYHGFDHIRPKARASRALVDDLIAALRRTLEAL
ncbi:alpha/beta hydrolase [Corynebacterium striatum]|uniref:alpha/beta hydrolase n=1 Tax=Corynebacterium striatum TaxID=43770 RepID=UPI001FC8463B|nr:alpha/beta hydrolase [Corynebacterium striatum]GKH16312.1 hypothetical protein CE91St29_06250 [Corynebacterium striatum]